MTAVSIETAFHSIAKQVASLDEVLGQICGANKETSTGIQQVNQAITQVDLVTQSNAAAAEENAASSEEMNAQANSLNEVVAEMQALVGINPKARYSTISEEATSSRKTSRGGSSMAALKVIRS